MQAMATRKYSNIGSGVFFVVHSKMLYRQGQFAAK
jgi:hypothetical protein